MFKKGFSNIINQRKLSNSSSQKREQHYRAIAVDRKTHYYNCRRQLRVSWSSLDYRLHSPDSPSFIAMSMSWRSSSLRMEDRKPSVVWFISPVPFWNISIRMRAAHRVPFTVHMNMLITRNCWSYSEHCTTLNASTDIATISYRRWLTR